MSNVFFIADLHLGHKGILKWAGQYRNNPKTIEEHDEWIIQQWNSIVKPKDTVKVLGDVCWTKDSLKLLKGLRGNKHLILGNHDLFALEDYQEYFSYIHGFKKYKGYILSHCPIHDSEMIRWKNIHGHIHESPNKSDSHFCVSVEHLNGVPISFEEIKKRMPVD